MVASGGDVGAANLTACSTGIGVLNGGRGGTVVGYGFVAAENRLAMLRMADSLCIST